MLIDIRLSELQSNTSNSIPLTLIIGIFFCYYLLQFLPYNIAIIGGGTNLYGALNFKFWNLLNEVTVTVQGKELFVVDNFVRANSSKNTVAGEANCFETLSDHYHSEFTKVPYDNVTNVSSTDDSPTAEINELAGPFNQESYGANFFNTFNINEYIMHSVGSPKNNNVTNVSSNAWDAYLVESNHIASIGNVMYTIYILWLILAALILVLAMLGAIVITIKPHSSSTEAPGAFTDTTLQSTTPWWAILMALFAFIVAMPGIISGNTNDFPGLVRSLQEALTALLHMIANDELNGWTAQLLLEALTQLRDQLPGIIDFLSNRGQETAGWFATRLREVIYPMVEEAIQWIIEFLRRR